MEPKRKARAICWPRLPICKLTYEIQKSFWEAREVSHNMFRDLLTFSWDHSGVFPEVQQHVSREFLQHDPRGPQNVFQWGLYNKFSGISTTGF